jgi:hypothetical protein
MKTNRLDIHLRKLMFLGFMLFIASACQASGGQTSNTIGAGEQMAAQDIDLVLGSGSFFLDDPLTGLADLSSYTATLTRTFDGSVSGEAQQWTESYVMMRDNGAGASQLTYSTAGDFAADPVLFAEIGQNAYAKSGAEVCTADSIDPEISSIERTDPAGLLSVLLGADEAGQEDVNGVAADHFTFDERALGKADLEDSRGEIWVAEDGGYILKYTLTTTGGDTAFGEGVEGTMTWDYALTEFNATVLPALPDGCQLNAPLLADATDVLHTPYWLAYGTATAVSDAADFYQEQLPGLGWTLLTGPLVGEASTFMEFTQGDQTIGVSISPGETGTAVNVVLYTSGE